MHGERIGTSHLMVIAVTALIVGMSALCYGGKSSHFVLDLDFRLLNDKLSYSTKGGRDR